MSLHHFLSDAGAAFMAIGMLNVVFGGALAAISLFLEWWTR